MSKLRLNNSGFTLIEMLVAVSVSSVILLMIYTAYSSILKTVNYGTALSGFYESLNLVLRKIDRDISNIYWREDGKAGFLCTVKNNSSVLTFVTYDFKDLRIINNIKEGHPVFDIYRVSYYLKPHDTGGYNSLIRSIEPGFTDKDTESITEEIILEKVRDFKVSMSLRNDWTDRWDSRENEHIPEFIKTSIEVEDIYGKPEIYEISTIPDMIND